MSDGVLSAAKAEERDQEAALGPLGRLVAHRPLLSAGVVLIGLTALVATAYRGVAPSVARGHLVFLFALATTTLGPALAAGAAAGHAALRFVAALLMLAFAAAAPFIAAATGLASGAAVGGGANPVVLIQAGAVSCAILLSLSRLVDPDVRAVAPAAAAIILGVAGAEAFGLLTTPYPAATESHATGDPMDVRRGASLAAAAAFIVAAGGAQRFGDVFAGGGPGRRAAAVAASRSAPHAVFAVGLLAVLFLTGGDEAGFVGDWLLAGRAVAVALFVIGAGLIVGGAGLAVRPESEEIAYAANRRRALVRRGLKNARGLLPSPTGLAVAAIALIAAIVAGFERADAAGAAAAPAEIALVAAGAVMAGLAFVSLRGALFLGGLLGVLVVLLGWPFTPFFGAMAAFDRAAGVALAAMALAPAALAWREARSPWRKARDVAAQALADFAPAYILSAALVLAALAAAAASGYWPAAGAVALWFFALWCGGLLLVGPWMVACGAVFGRDFS